jgi:hypothetical protein
MIVDTNEAKPILQEVTGLFEVPLLIDIPGVPLAIVISSTVA